MTAGLSPRAAGRQRRFRRSAVLALVVLAAGVLVAELLRPSASPSVGIDPAAAVVAPDDLTSTWFCAAGTSQPGGAADETVVVANAATRAGARARVRISVLTGTDAAGEPIPPVTRTVTVGPAAEVRIPVSELVRDANPGVVVEGSGAPIVVTHLLRGGGDTAAGACARGGSDRWFFGGGSTVLGSNLTLWLFNPFPGDAVVDLSFSTDTGNEAPNEFQGLVVPGRTRLAVALDAGVRRRTVVAAEVRTRRGRVVAEQTQALDGRDGRRGLALVAGAPAVADSWFFDGGVARGDRTTTLTVANPGDEVQRVRIETTLAGVVRIEPVEVEVPPRGVTLVDAGARVPADTPYALHLTSTGGAGVVAHELTAIANGGGIAADGGTSFASSRWYVVPGRVGTDPVDAVSVLARPSRSIRWRADAVGPDPRRIAAGRLRAGGLVRVPTDATGALVISASGPVVVGRDSGASPGVTLAMAVPVCPSPIGSGGSPC
ncbi:MAG: DUF5719 family protein [Actinomycetes bacterium]